MLAPSGAFAVFFIVEALRIRIALSGSEAAFMIRIGFWGIFYSYYV